MIEKTGIAKSSKIKFVNNKNTHNPKRMPINYKFVNDKQK